MLSRKSTFSLTMIHTMTLEDGSRHIRSRFEDIIGGDHPDFQMSVSARILVRVQSTDFLSDREKPGLGDYAWRNVQWCLS